MKNPQDKPLRIGLSEEAWKFHEYISKRFWDGCPILVVSKQMAPVLEELERLGGVNVHSFNRDYFVVIVRVPQRVV